jgi:hypothetical protein
MNRSKLPFVVILPSALVGFGIGWCHRPPPNGLIGEKTEVPWNSLALGAISQTQKTGVLASPNNPKMFANIDESNGQIVIAVSYDVDHGMGLIKTEYGATFPVELGWFVMIDDVGNTYYGVDGKWVNRIREIRGKVKIISLKDDEKARVFEVLVSSL